VDANKGWVDNLHLSPVSAVVQVHPQLHHLDALDEIPAKGKGKRKDEEEGGGGNEARAIDVKVKGAEDGEAGIMASNIDLLKKMQEEKWGAYDWIDAEVSVYVLLLRLFVLMKSSANSIVLCRLRSRGMYMRAT
jgi:hypothetical protein